MFVMAFVIGLTGAMMPGPVLVATINRSARMGFKAGPLVVLGHAIIEALLVTAIILGIGAALQKPLVMNPILIGGGAMLVFLGVTIINEVRLRKVSLPTAADPGLSNASESALRPIAEGILTSVSNPYWMLWWATTGLALISKAGSLGGLGVPTFYAGHILSDLAWYSLVSGSIAMGVRYLTDSVYRAVLSGCSLFLIGLGTVFAFQGASALLSSA
jgi:threonine/homoserine/homoserine lactone efflux protein